ncbi:MAG: hypothetical protein AAGH92_05975 [Planctomycetota bacterium]
MRRRRPDFQDDALDLFLDAISNVFGGILFIALAVVVLLQFTVPMPAQPETVVAEVPAVFLPADLEALLAEAQTEDLEPTEQLTRLREAIAVQREALPQRQAAHEAAQREAKQAADQVREAERLAAEQQEALVEARDTLEALRRRPTQRVRAARFRPSAKQEVPLMVADQRIVRPLNDAGNVDRAALTLDADAQTARPAPGAGIPIPTGAAGDAAVTRLLASLNPQTHYLNAAVWPTGFDAARQLRDAAIDLGFEFTLTPVPDGQGVPFNAASGVQ